MAAPQLAAKACHNCRRSRLKCDRSLPTCSKCANRGQDCQGYGRLLRWEPGIASRGKMMGLTYNGTIEDQRREKSCLVAYTSEDFSILPVRRPGPTALSSITLADPFVQDLGRMDRRYLAYCEYLRPYLRPYLIFQTLTAQTPAMSAKTLSSTIIHVATHFEIFCR